MKLQLVKVTAAACKFICYRCNQKIDGTHEQVWADLDGPAFRAYYHGACLPGENNETLSYLY